MKGGTLFQRIGGGARSLFQGAVPGHSIKGDRASFFQRISKPDSSLFQCGSVITMSGLRKFRIISELDSESLLGIPLNDNGEQDEEVVQVVSIKINKIVRMENNEN